MSDFGSSGIPGKGIRIPGAGIGIPRNAGSGLARQGPAGAYTLVGAFTLAGMHPGGKLYRNPESSILLEVLGFKNRCGI